MMKVYELIEHSEGHGMGWPTVETSLGLFATKAAARKYKKSIGTMSFSIVERDVQE